MAQAVIEDSRLFNTFGTVEEVIARLRAYAARHLWAADPFSRSFPMTETRRFFVDRLETPTGTMRIIADPQGRLRAVDWDDYEPRLLKLLRLHYGEDGYLLEVRDDPFGFTSALRAYFGGDLSAIDALPTATEGTAFQREVWAALRDIPCGTTTSYGALAKRIGRPAAVRAVGLANGANPIGVVVPCHRVIGSTGALTGYGGGMERKRWLLAHEGAALL